MSSEQTRILLVEDDAKLAALVHDYLEEQGFVVQVEPRGDTALATIDAFKPDLLLLDVLLPGMDGLTICRMARPTFPGPILMLTAQDEDLDEVVGLEVGADDYLTKPVRPRVLLARIRALLRRSATGQANSQRVCVGALMIDSGRRIAEYEGVGITLTSAEFDLLWLLCKHVGVVVSRDMIYRQLRGIEHDGVDRSIDLRISHLRSKLGDSSGSLIKSVRGIGYQLVSTS